MEGLFYLVCLLSFGARVSDASSIYVGRHASASRPQLVNAYEECQDFDGKLCQKMLFWFGHKACKESHDTASKTKNLNKICPKSCGLCDCKDTGDFCSMLSPLCHHDNETGKFMTRRCPKTCNLCRKSKDEKPELVDLPF